MRAPQGCLRSTAPSPAKSLTTWIVRTTQVHLGFRTHILAAVRLFTCQRARLSHTSRNPLRFVAVISSTYLFPVEGGGIISSTPPLSTGCREDFLRPSRRPNRPHIHSRQCRRSMIYRSEPDDHFRGVLATSSGHSTGAMAHLPRALLVMKVLLEQRAA